MLVSAITASRQTPISHAGGFAPVGVFLIMIYTTVNLIGIVGTSCCGAVFGVQKSAGNKIDRSWKRYLLNLKGSAIQK
jgi:hypothetical protein